MMIAFITAPIMYGAGVYTWQQGSRLGKYFMDRLAIIISFG
jgi:hypothetical protein